MNRDYYIMANITEIHRVKAESEEEAMKQMKDDMAYKYSRDVSNYLNYTVDKVVDD